MSYEIVNHMNIKVFRLSALALLVGLVTSVAARGESGPWRVVTSFYPVYVTALNVTAGVEGVEVSNLTSAHLGCLHDYQFTAGDVRQLAEADLVRANGAGMEPFLDKVVRQSPGLRVVEVSEGIPLLDGNSHVWVSFDGARRQTDNVVAALSALAPEHAAAFRANGEAYQARLGALEERMRAALAPYAGTPIVNFRLEIAGVIEREPGTEPSARELADTVKLVRAGGVKALFAEPQFSDRSARVIAAETGARVYELDPVVTGPAAPDEARGAWLAAMEKNLAVLRDALR